jgi:hypothetical protein
MTTESETLIERYIPVDNIDELLKDIELWQQKKKHRSYLRVLNKKQLTTIKSTQGQITLLLNMIQTR